MKKYDDFRKNAKVKYINKLKEIRYKQSIISAGKKTHRLACGMNC